MIVQFDTVSSTHRSSFDFDSKVGPCRWLLYYQPYFEFYIVHLVLLLLCYSKHVVQISFLHVVIV